MGQAEARPAGHDGDAGGGDLGPGEGGVARDPGDGGWVDGPGHVSVGGPAVVRARPPTGPLKVFAGIAAVTVPMAVLATFQGDITLGVVALISAAWAGAVAYLGWTAHSVADDGGVTVHWMRRSQSVRWSEVRGVEVDRSGPGGTARGVRFLLDDERSLPWTPWVALLWFAQSSAKRTVADLEVVVDRAGCGPIVDPSPPPPRSRRGRPPS